MRGSVLCSYLVDICRCDFGRWRGVCSTYSYSGGCFCPESNNFDRVGVRLRSIFSGESVVGGYEDPALVCLAVSVVSVLPYNRVSR